MTIRNASPSCILASLLVCTPICHAATQHDNKVDFFAWPNSSYPSDNCAGGIPGPQVSSIVFYFAGEYSVTPGQPWGGVTVNDLTQAQGYPAYQADVLAGRKASPPPGDFFNLHSGNMNVGGCFSAVHNIVNLNFALTGVLEIEGKDYQIVLGQVGEGEQNCWYLGPNETGFNFVFDSGGYTNQDCEYLATPDGEYRIGVTDNMNNYTFYISRN